MLELALARARILENLPVLGVETISLANAAGRVTASPVIARLSNPPSDVSAMDGYAVRATDLGAGRSPGTKLTVVATAPAGHPTTRAVGQGEAVRLFTGSVMPAGADAVLIQENTQREGDEITVSDDTTLSAGRFVRHAGQDFAQGQAVLPAGRRLTARDIGLVAAANCPWLTVRRHPKVALLATGDEIAMPGEPVPPGGIVDSCIPMLSALLRNFGAEPVVLPIARDNEAALGEAIAGLSGMDLVVTVGGASVGDYDLVQKCLKQAGLEAEFWKIAMRPGKPLMFGRLGRLPVIGLPGNPVAAFVCALTFILPALRVMAGEPVEDLSEEARLGADVPANDLRFDHLRATLARDEAGRWVASPFARQDSAMLHVLAQSDALVLRDAHAPAAKAGERCRIIRLTPFLS